MVKQRSQRRGMHGSPMIGRSRFRQTFLRTASGFLRSLPVIAGVLALTSLLTVAAPPTVLAELLPLQGVLGPIFGALAGSVAAGHAMTSYVLAGEFLSAGLSLATATAFLVAWLTVGVAQLPAEAAALGLRFAVWRNVVSFALSIATGISVAAVLSVLA